jgi:hypothetical protein
MAIDTIDAAILAHRTWVGGFKSAYKGINTETFDLAKARDSSNCLLGRWLSTEAAALHLGSESLQKIVEQHREFHQVAGTIAELLNHGQMNRQTEVLVEQFDDISKELVRLLRLAKTRN